VSPRRIVPLLLVPILVACSQVAINPPTAGPATATPFQAAPPTATPEVVRLWLSPALPEGLRQAAAGLDGLDGRPVEIVEEESAADVVLGPNPDTPLTTWIYALVAPFPTVQDDLTAVALVQAWQGQSAHSLLVANREAEALQSLLGAGSPLAYDAAELQAAAWDQSAFALVPFDELNPRWKVLTVDGADPLLAGFDPNAYPLAIEFGASGPPDQVAALSAALPWPVSNRDPQALTVVAMTGVTALTRATAWAIERESIAWAVSDVAEWLAAADITHVSHEVAFTPECPPVNPSRDVMRFCGQPYQIEVLEAIGTDVIELTGNHVMDYGADALLYTLDQYRARGWQTYGGGTNRVAGADPAIFDHHGNRIAFVGCNPAGPGFAWATDLQPGSQPCDYPVLLDQITRLRADGYLPIVTFQWAESYRSWPLPDQAEAFRQAAAAGAVIVSGSQAHQPMGLEFQDDSLIHFGLGNLFFDQMWSEPTRQEFLDLHVFYRGQHISTRLLTAMLEDYARPRAMTAEEREAFLTTIFGASGW